MVNVQVTYWVSIGSVDGFTLGLNMKCLALHWVRGEFAYNETRVGRELGIELGKELGYTNQETRRLGEKLGSVHLTTEWSSTVVCLVPGDGFEIGLL